MEFAFTPEQEELRAQARAFLAERYPVERLAELGDAGAWDESSWSAFAELGWLGVSIPEEHGGAGLGFLEEAVLFEELGRALYSGPYFSTFALALPALGPDELAAVAGGEGRWSAEVDGLVPDWGHVDHVVAGSEAVAPRGEALVSIDPTRPLGRVANGNGGGTTLAGELSRPRALAALALEAIGVGQRALELGMEHVSTRKQFGKPIGAYQAVSHQLADTFVELELARSLAYWAAWCVAEDDAQAPVAAAAAKSQAAEAAVAACERSIQVHGGTGFTWEHVLHRLYKRTLWVEGFMGSGVENRAAVAEALLVGEALPA